MAGSAPKTKLTAESNIVNGKVDESEFTGLGPEELAKFIASNAKGFTGRISIVLEGTWNQPTEN